MAFEGARVYRSTNQEIAHGGWREIDFDTERWDTDSMWDVGNPSRITVKTAGKYLFVLCVGFAANVTSNRALLLVLNGSTNIVMTNDKAMDVGGNILIVSTIWDCSENDYVIAKAMQESGGALDLVASLNAYPEFMAQRLDA